MVESFLEPTFEDSRFVDFEISGGIEALALVVGATSSLPGIGLAYVLYVRRPGHDRRPRAAAAARFTRFLVHKWYFDELYDVLFVRPLRALGQGASNVFERVVIQGMVGGTTLAVRAGNSLVRVAQTGPAALLRAAAAGRRRRRSRSTSWW